MTSFLRALHSLSVALWFGSVAFFAIAALLIFRAFEEESRWPKEERAPWFPLPARYDREPSPEGLPNPLRLEQGSRAAGVAVGKVFPVYYALQLGCAVVALITALLLARGGTGRWHRTRVTLCAVALITVVLGWILEAQVAALREPRNWATDSFLGDNGPLSAAVKARRAFGFWHGMNLLQSYVTLGLAASLTALVPPLGAPARDG